MRVEPSSMGLVPLEKAQRALWSLPPREDTAPAAVSEPGSALTRHRSPAPGLGPPNLQSCGKYMSVVHKSPVHGVLLKQPERVRQTGSQEERVSGEACCRAVGAQRSRAQRRGGRSGAQGDGCLGRTRALPWRGGPLLGFPEEFCQASLHFVRGKLSEECFISP